ncbi:MULTISPECIES: amino acid ABC transporter ATP-binding protein [Jonquetella]|uniref:ABC-type polar amino acid transport system, ATPase component n=1 Tax=Jonquetella anthropi DSM 22815 TaxID=885272 RepID=H0ULY6_9BACT|nr:MULTISPECIES: amino acid ABC transporter ATP-binding protein [Jonquetella]EEX47546.1 ABC transporter, ATP-binding protein [Jonquetella anthropi E3_33 E1]EHM12528.1 ABC-type polar amino acid transport system, ATPase component [Jonquetella anthropi DSM 22815]ERL24579.1 ABC transporter, ATP-binding protein [Jonquetella sp. BV3C21]
MISVQHLGKSFEGTPVLRDVSFSLQTGHVMAVIGPSGTGKSTLLRCINCLEKADRGTVTIADTTVDFQTIRKLETLFLRRHTGMVFQSFNLFANKTALENITEGLTVVRRVPPDQARETGLQILERIGLADKKDSYPQTLSGGQQQRIAIGRALALDPKVLLLDEPTSALDPELVNEVLRLIGSLAKQQQTMIIVTHEISFAASVAHEICFMDQGQIIEHGPADQIIGHPKSERLQQFLNSLAQRGVPKGSDS